MFHKSLRHSHVDLLGKISVQKRRFHLNDVSVPSVGQHNHNGYMERYVVHYGSKVVLEIDAGRLCLANCAELCAVLSDVIHAEDPLTADNPPVFRNRGLAVVSPHALLYHFPELFLDGFTSEFSFDRVRMVPRCLERCWGVNAQIRTSDQC